MATTLPLQQTPEPGAGADFEFERERHATWKRFRRHKLAIAGSVVLAVIILVAVFAPFLTPWNPNYIDQAHWNGYPLPPGAFGHLLGTDENGRDLLARLMFGARISLTVGIFAVVIEVVVGTFLGALAGYYGKWVDYAIMRVTDVFLSIPLLPLLLVLTAIVAASSNKAALSFGVIVLIIGGLGWMPVTRLVRASYLSLREKEFTEAARAIGSSDGRIMFRHLLPNAVAPIIVQATLDIANVIILESALSFLGFGIQPPTASWGNMLANAQYNMAIAPWAAIFPGLCILVTVLSINYMGDGLRDALDPNMR
ncbi:MAG TPA: oligopeptide ABC transporter permease [Candidatus Dormibacteraeota bacterium]|nr:oligopeptide ABC transporter permease [Candidatus Dormibacteraeota bacterium]